MIKKDKKRRNEISNYKVAPLELLLSVAESRIDKVVGDKGKMKSAIKDGYIHLSNPNNDDEIILRYYSRDVYSTLLSSYSVDSSR